VLHPSADPQNDPKPMDVSANRRTRTDRRPDETDQRRPSESTDSDSPSIRNQQVTRSSRVAGSYRPSEGASQVRGALRLDVLDLA
jgi:hypothetical protein